MDLETRQTVQRIRYTLLTLGLGLMAAVLAAVLWIVTRAHASAEAETARMLLVLAWTAAAMLGITLLALLWILLRWGKLRLQGPSPLPPAPYVDAWSEAGRRMQPPPHDEPDDENSV